MPWNGSSPNETFGRTDGTRTGTTVWQDAEAAAVDIVSDDHDTHDQDIGTSLNECLKKDGGNKPTANINMGSFKFTSVADASAQAEFPSAKQVMNGELLTCTVGGTADVITLTTDFSFSAYVAGMAFRFVATGTNTTTVTVNVDAIGAKAIQYIGNALSVGDIVSGLPYDIVYDGTQFQLDSQPSTTVKAANFSAGGTAFNKLPVGTTAQLGVAATKGRLGYDSTKDRIVYDGGSTLFSLANLTDLLTRGLIDGVVLANGTDAAHDVNIAAGVARDSTNAFTFRFTSTEVKQIDAVYATGSAAGGFPSGLTSGTEQASTWYHIFLVDDGSGATEAGFDTSLTATNLLSDTGGSFFRRIGSVLTDGSANILPFLQVGDHYTWDDPNAHKGIDGGSSATSAALVVHDVPLGVKVYAKISVAVDGNANFCVYFSDPDISAQTPTDLNGRVTLCALNGPTTGLAFEVWTDTSSQLRWQSSVAGRTTNAAVIGWMDLRGKHA